MRGRSFLVGFAVVAVVGAITWSTRRALHPAEVATSRPSVSCESAPTREGVVPASALATRQTENAGADGELPPEDGSSARAAGATEDSVPAGWPVSPDGVLIHVIDVVTKNEIDDVTLLLQDTDGYSWGPHPAVIASRKVIVEHARSPVRVVPRVVNRDVQPVSALWIGAPGHAWTDFKVEFSIKEDRSVELLPAAALVVDLQGVLPQVSDPDDAPQLRLRRPPSRSSRLGDLIAELPARLGATPIDGLAGGEFTASVEIGWVRYSPLVVGSVAVRLVEHQTTHAALVLPAVEMPEPVPFAGTLFVPEVWSQYRFDLVICPLDLIGQIKSDFQVLPIEEMREIADRPGWRRFSAGRLHPATYRCEIDTFGFSRAIKVAPPGNENVELIVPDAATVTITVVDHASGEPLALTNLSWVTGRDSDRARTTIAMHHRGDDPCFEATIPIGPGSVETSDYEWLLDDPSARAEIHAGSQELIVRAHRACGLFLEFMRDGKPANPLDDLYTQATLEAVGHSGSSPNQSFESGVGFTFFCTAPGRYRVTIPKVPGDAPIAPFEVDLPAATIEKHVVELKRR